MTTGALVAWGAALGTFVASVMADDQAQRLRNGTFGAIAGASLGGAAALFANNKLLVLYGVFGSAIGASAAWLVYLILAFVARKPAGRRMLEYHIRGLAGVHDQLIADENSRLREALDLWGANFARTIDRERDTLVREEMSISQNKSIALAIYNWLSTIVNTFNLVLDAIAESSTDYRCRATLILFGYEDGNRSGAHWISFAGRLAAHRKTHFGSTSYAAMVLAEELQSPKFTTAEDANTQGQERGGADRYYSFVMIRVNDEAVLSVDWPGKLDEHDPYMVIVRDLFHLEVGPAVAELLTRWTGHPQEQVGLRPRPDTRNALGEADTEQMPTGPHADRIQGAKLPEQMSAHETLTS